MSAHLADATCRRGEKCMYFSFEESPAQILRNMASINIRLGNHVKKGLLKFHSARPTVHGLEMHLVKMHKLIEEFNPAVVIIDPVSNLQTSGTLDDSTSMLIRLIDFLRAKKITAFMVSLTSGSNAQETTDEGLSSMVDAWLLLRDIETGGERNRLMYVLKARGMAHSNQVSEFLITARGIKLIPAYLGAAEVLTGSARLSQEARDAAEKELIADEVRRKKMSLEHRRRAIEAQVENLRAEFRAEEEEFARLASSNLLKDKQVANERSVMAANRRADRSK